MTSNLIKLYENDSNVSNISAITAERSGLAFDICCNNIFKI